MPPIVPEAAQKSGSSSSRQPTPDTPRRYYTPYPAWPRAAARSIPTSAVGRPKQTHLYAPRGVWGVVPPSNKHSAWEPTSPTERPRRGVATKKATPSRVNTCGAGKRRRATPLPSAACRRRPPSPGGRKRDSAHHIRYYTPDPASACGGSALRHDQCRWPPEAESPLAASGGWGVVPPNNKESALGAQPAN